MDTKLYNYGFSRACWERNLDPRDLRKVAQDAGSTTVAPSLEQQIPVTNSINTMPSRPVDWWGKLSLGNRLSSLPTLMQQLFKNAPAAKAAQVTNAVNRQPYHAPVAEPASTNVATAPIRPIAATQPSPGFWHNLKTYFGGGKPMINPVTAKITPRPSDFHEGVRAIGQQRGNYQRLMDAIDNPAVGTDL